MENPEEILHSLEEFSKLKPKDIPRELEEYLCFVAKTGDPVYQWPVIKSLFREKLINVITEFYESCPSMDIPPCPNVDMFNYDTMKSFILEKLDTFVAAPFTVQRICELLTTPRKEYNRIDKYMRALEKNILVVSTTEPGNHRTPENGDGFVNGIETEHMQDGSNDINIEEMDDTPAWPTESVQGSVLFQSTSKTEMIIDSTTTETTTQESNSSSSSSSSSGGSNLDTVITCTTDQSYVATSLWQGESFQSTSKTEMVIDTCTMESSNEATGETDLEVSKKVVITCCRTEESNVSIEPVDSDNPQTELTTATEENVSVTITAIPATIQKRRLSNETESTNEAESDTTIEKNSETAQSLDDKASGDAPKESTPSEDSKKGDEEPTEKVEPLSEIIEPTQEEELISDNEKAEQVLPTVESQEKEVPPEIETKEDITEEKIKENEITEKDEITDKDEIVDKNEITDTVEITERVEPQPEVANTEQQPEPITKIPSDEIILEKKPKEAIEEDNSTETPETSAVESVENSPLNPEPETIPEEVKSPTANVPESPMEVDAEITSTVTAKTSKTEEN